MKFRDSGTNDENITIFSAATIPLKSGAGLHAFSLSRCISAKGYTTRLVTFNWGKFQFERVFEDNVPIRRIPFFYRNKLQKVLSLVIQFPFLLYYLVRSDVFLIYGPVQGYMAMILLGAVFRKRVVYRSTMLGMDDVQSLVEKYPMLAGLRKRILLTMYGYYSQNPAMTQQFLAAGGDRNKVFESAQGVDTKYFYPVKKSKKDELRRSLAIPVDSVIILSVGYLIERKGFREIFDVLAEIDDDFIYVVVGDYDVDEAHYLAGSREEMRALYDYGKGLLNERLHFTGPVENVIDYYKASDIFILNSSMEGTPNVLLESMACGLASAVRKIEGVDGYLTHTGDNSEVIQTKSELSSVLNRLLHDVGYREKLAINARESILRKFSLDQVTDNLLRKFL